MTPSADNLPHPIPPLLTPLIPFPYAQNLTFPQPHAVTQFTHILDSRPYPPNRPGG